MTLFRKAILLLAGVFGLLLVGAAILIGPTIYRVVHGVDVYETVAPELPKDLRSPAVLVFSKTNGFRDDASIQAANAMFREVARKRGWSVYFTESGAVFNAPQLAHFNTVVWNSVSGDVLMPAQRQAFVDYLQGGGGFVGVHGSGGDPSYRWRWYVDHLIGAQFIGHTMWPHLQRGTIHVEDPAHPAMSGLPRTWIRTEEWYSFDHSVRAKGYRVLATLDESTYKPKGLFFDDIRMGRDHPLIWTHCVGRGRAVYSALGHAPETYSEPLHKQLLANAVAWSMSPSACANGL